MLFIYGTLQDDDVLGAVLGRAVSTASFPNALAPNFRAIAYPGRVYPALVRAPDDAAPGLLLDGLTPLELEMLDAFEGAEYRRAPLSVRVGARDIVAEAYLPVIDIDPAAPRWWLADWRRLHKPTVLSTEQQTALALRQRLTGAG